MNTGRVETVAYSKSVVVKGMKWLRVAVLAVVAVKGWIVPRRHPRGGVRRAEPDATRPREVEETVYGAHYCGGDPCSSAHNDDPFDEQGGKQDEYASFKDRVNAIAARKAEALREGP